MSVKVEAVKIAADSAAGVTIGEATDTNGLIVTVITIISRVLIELIINRRTKRQSKEQPPA